MTRYPGSYAGLTVKQADLLSFIRAACATGPSPSYDEMCQGIGLASRSQAFNLVRQLESRGFVETGGYGRARTIRPLEQDRPLRGVPIDRLIAELEARKVITPGSIAA